MKSLFLAAAAFCVLSTPALAAAPVVVKLASPLPASKQVVAGGAIFICASDACVAANPIEGTGDFTTCKIVARAVGPLLAFGTSSAPLAADRLNTCNESAKK